MKQFCLIPANKQPIWHAANSTCYKSDGTTKVEDAKSKKACLFPPLAKCTAAGGEWQTGTGKTPIDMAKCKLLNGKWTPSTTCSAIRSTKSDALEVFQQSSIFILAVMFDLQQKKYSDG